MPTAADPFADRTPSDRSPGDDAFAITPDDTAGNELAKVVRFIWVGVSGDLTVITERGTTVLFKAAPVGLFSACRVRQVKSTGTTATNLVGIP